MGQESPCPTANLPDMTHLSRRALLRASSAGAAAIAAGGALAGPAAALPSAGPSAAGGPSVAAGPVLAHVRPRTAAQLALMARLDDTHTTFDDGTVEVVLHDGDQALLDAVGMSYDVVPAPVSLSQRDVALPLQPGETADGEYRLGSGRYEADLKALAEAHAGTGRVRLLTMDTPSLLGTTVYGVEIATDVANDDGRPVVMHDGMHHCREWPAGEMPMMWAHELLEGYGTDPDITAIVDGVRTVILPLVNPDGFDRTVEAAAITGQTSDEGDLGLVLAVTGQGDMWRKNVRALTNEGPLAATGPVVGGSPVGASQPDAYGIDLNRNYPFHWGDESGSSSVPVDQTYRGTAPFSEPETHNVRDLVRSHLPLLHITHHTAGQQMLIPWGRDPYEIRSPDWQLMADIAREMRDGFTTEAGTELPGNGYDPIQAFNLYPTSGTSRDYGHAATRTIIYTFEHGTEFHGTYVGTIPAMYAQNRGAFIRHSLAALEEDVQAVITGEGEAGGTVVITKSFQTPTNLQIAGTPVLRPGGMPAVADPAAGVLRPELVDEALRKEVRIGDDGTFTIVVPPSTRPYLLNEEQLDGFSRGETEAYTVSVLDAAGVEAYGCQVTVERGFTAEIGPDSPVVDAFDPDDLVTESTPGDYPIPAPE